MHALELKPDLPAAQLHRSELVEHEAHVQARTVAAKIHEQATAAHQTLKLRRVLVLEQLLGQQLGIRHVVCLPDELVGVEGEHEVGGKPVEVALNGPNESFLFDPIA